jgi:hypothetical protein
VVGRRACGEVRPASLLGLTSEERAAEHERLGEVVGVERAHELPPLDGPVIGVVEALGDREVGCDPRVVGR